jgi:hypothetical protein
MCWSAIESALKQCVQQVFAQIGLGVTEKSYHEAVFATLCRQKHRFECAHLCCSVHSETMAPIAISDTKLLCGAMRSDIVLEWTQATSKKRMRCGTPSPPTLAPATAAAAATARDSTVCILEFKATGAPIASAAVLQLLCYMRSHDAQYGLVCNFLQRCDVVQQALTTSDRLCFQIGENRALALLGDGTSVQPLLTQVEFCTVELRANEQNLC